MRSLLHCLLELPLVGQGLGCTGLRGSRPVGGSGPSRLTHTALTISLGERSDSGGAPAPTWARPACWQQRGAWGPLGAQERRGYLMSQPGAVVAVHGEALGVTRQVCQGVLGGREDGEAWR